MKKASYQSVMIIKVPFVLICVSVALLYLCVVYVKERNLFPNRSAITVFFPSALHLYLSKHTKEHIKMLLIYQATFLDISLFECFTKAQQILLQKLM